MLALRRGVAAEERAAAGARVCERIALLREFAEARRVVAYAALEREVPVAAAVATALAAQKRVLWPRVGSGGRIDVAESHLDDLTPDAAGVLAPPASRGASSLMPGDLVLVPGLAFTREGARLGRGGGHYDRLLGGEHRVITIGVAFDIQLVRELPMEPHDRRVSIVVTPSGVWRTR